MPVRIKAQTHPQIGGPAVDVVTGFSAGEGAPVDRRGGQAVALAGHAGDAGPVVDGVGVAVVVGVAVSLDAEPGQVAVTGFIQGVDFCAFVLELAVIVAVVGADADPLAGFPLRRNIAVQVQPVLIVRGQFAEVGAVFAEALRRAEIGLEQGGVEGPVQGFDVGIAPHAVIVVQALATEFELFAGVSGEAFVADPELA